MAQAIAWIFVALLRLLLPPSGRHRAAEATNGRPAVRRQVAPTMHTARRPDAPVRPVSAERTDGLTAPIRLASGPPGQYGATMVRPYVVAYERQRERRAELRLRRRALWLAVHGIDIGPPVIHDVRVVA